MILSYIRQVEPELVCVKICFVDKVCLFRTCKIQVVSKSTYTQVITSLAVWLLGMYCSSLGVGQYCADNAKRFDDLTGKSYELKKLREHWQVLSYVRWKAET